MTLNIFKKFSLVEDSFALVLEATIGQGKGPSDYKNTFCVWRWNMLWPFCRHDMVRV